MHIKVILQRLSMFILSAPFPGHANAVIVTPTPLKADVHNTGVVITPSQLGGVCFQLLFLCGSLFFVLTFIYTGNCTYT